MTLVDNKAIVELAVKGESTGKLYEGKFILKLFLTLKQRNEIAVQFSTRDFGNTKDNLQSTINQLVCELQARCEECPQWFKGDKAWDLEDVQPILELKKELDNALEKHLSSIEE